MEDAESGLTAQDVRDAVLEKPPWGKRGYQEKSVLDFLALTARRLDGRGHMTAQDVRDVSFPKPPLGRRGVDEGQVNALLNDIAEAIARLDGAS